MRFVLCLCVAGGAWTDTPTTPTAAGATAAQTVSLPVCKYTVDPLNTITRRGWKNRERKQQEEEMEEKKE